MKTGEAIMTHETKTMEVPVAIADRVQALIDGFKAKEIFKAERKAVVNNFLAMDGLSCEMAVYSLPQNELLDTLRFVYELSGTNSKFITNILIQSRENPKNFSFLTTFKIRLTLSSFFNPIHQSNQALRHGDKIDNK